jgi:hypothetical protein
MKKLVTACRTWIQAHPFAPLELVRIYVGLGLLIKGLFFLQNREVLDTMLQAAALPPLPMSVAGYVIWAHVVGGVQEPWEKFQFNCAETTGFETLVLRISEGGVTLEVAVAFWRS